MSRQARRIGRALHALMPPLTVTLVDSHGVRQHRLSTGGRLLANVALIFVLVWTTIASVNLMRDLTSPEDVSTDLAVLRDTYEARLETLAAERDALASRADDVVLRLREAEETLAHQQAELMQYLVAGREAEASVAAMRAQMTELLQARDSATLQSDTLLSRLGELRGEMVEQTGSRAETDATIDAITVALTETAALRDRFAAEAARMAEQIEQMELQAQLTRQRHDRMFQQLETAIQASLGPLESMLTRTGLDLDALLLSVQRAYSGTGGMTYDPGRRSQAGDAPPDPTAERIGELMADLDKLAMLNIAASSLPLAMPVRASHRFTSPFGMRGGRMHRGVDFAAGSGTPILTTGDGTVVFAGWFAGYGNLIRIRHDFGFETYYAHLSRIRVEVGDRVARGDRIGDMGTTGRSTGVHLHYEIRKNGVAVDPMTYIRVARNVF